MKEIDKNVLNITGYELSDCRYDDESYIVEKIKDIIPNVNINVYSFIKDGIEIIYSKDLYRLLLKEDSKHISEFIYDEVLSQVEKIGDYFSDETIDKISEGCCLLPEEELSDEYRFDGALDGLMDVYFKTKRVRKQSKREKHRYEKFCMKNKI